MEALNKAHAHVMTVKEAPEVSGLMLTAGARHLGQYCAQANEVMADLMARPAPTRRHAHRALLLTDGPGRAGVFGVQEGQQREPPGVHRPGQGCHGMHPRLVRVSAAGGK